MQARDTYVRTVDALFSKAFRKVFSPFHPVFSCDCCFAGMPLSDAPLQCASCSDGWQDSILCRESRPTMMLMIMLLIMMRILQTSFKRSLLQLSFFCILTLFLQRTVTGAREERNPDA